LSIAPLGALAYRQRAIRAEVAVALAISAAFLAYNSGALNPFGGWTPGPRYLMPALPFAAILVALAPAVLRPIVAFQIAVSVGLVFVATVTMPNAPEAYRDPLVDLWLPRLLDGNIADTLAWERWGFHGIQPLVILVVALGLAGVAIVGSYQPATLAHRATAGIAGALAVSIVALALPILPPWTARALGGAAGQPGQTVALVDLGAAIIRPGPAEAAIWVQAENIGPALDGTRVVFTTYAPDGRQAWSAWYGGISWRQGERKRLAIAWDTSRVPRGAYRLVVAVTSKDLSVVYSAGRSMSLIDVHP